nr:hypothetical protein XYFPCFBP8417_11175 [Xylella fastidiosa subsp. multiplex]
MDVWKFQRQHCVGGGVTVITLLTHISNAPLFGNVVGLVLLARRVARAIGITGTLLLGAVADTQKHARRHQDPRVIARVPSHGPASLTGGAALTGGFICLTQSSRGLAGSGVCLSIFIRTSRSMSAMWKPSLVGF